MCPYLETSGSNSYCGMSSRMLGDRRVRNVCETDACYDCSSYNKGEYDSDSGFFSHEREESYEEQEEPEYEYEDN